MTSSRSCRPGSDSPFDYDVIVPAFNAAGTIAATLRSLVNQQIPPRSVFVVDDGSSDDTAAVAEQFPVQVHRRPHAGVAATRAFGLQLVQAPIFAVADADDEWLPKMSTSQATWWHNSNSRTGAIGASPVIVSEIVPFESTPDADISLVAAAVVVPPVYAWRQNPLTSSATFYSTDAVRSIGGFGHRESAEDYDTHLRLLAAGFELRVSRTPGVVYHERMGSVTSHIARGLKAHIELLSEFHGSRFRQVNYPELSLERRLRQAYGDTLKLALRRRQPLAPLRHADALSLLPRRLRPFAAVFTRTGMVTIPVYHGLLRIRAVYWATLKQSFQKR